MIPVSEAHRRHVAEHGEVHAEDDPVRLAAVCDGGVEGANAGVRQEQAQPPADEREQGALDQQLPDHPGPAGAERESDGDLARAFGGAGEEQVGDVGAGDEQHEPHSAEQREEHDPDRTTVESLIEGQDLGVDILVRIGILRLQLLRESAQLDLGLGSGDSLGRVVRRFGCRGSRAFPSRHPE